jgi:mannan endo-1,4-beta-mannosidase
MIRAGKTCVVVIVIILTSLGCKSKMDKEVAKNQTNFDKILISAQCGFKGLSQVQTVLSGNHQNQITISNDSLKLSEDTLSIDLQKSNSFYTIGHKLYDAKGSEFVIRGINNPHIWFRDTALRALDTIAKYRANTVRIVWLTKGRADKLREIIQMVVDRNMIAMPELHDFTGGDEIAGIEKAASYWTSDSIKPILEEFKPYLMINIANEWTSWGQDSIWFNGYKSAIKKMRDAGLNHCLVIDGAGWGQDIDPVKKHAKELLEFDPQQNLLFDIHMYMGWNDTAKITQEMNYVVENNIPLIVGEFGYDYNEGRNNLQCRVNANHVLKTCKQLGIGFMPWSWSGNNKENKWLDIIDDWQGFTPWGKQVMFGPDGIYETAKTCTVYNNNRSAEKEKKTFHPKGNIKWITIKSGHYDSFTAVNQAGETIECSDEIDGSFLFTLEDLQKGIYSLRGISGNHEREILCFEII